MNKLNELELEEAQDTVETVEVGGRFIIEDLDSANWSVMSSSSPAGYI